MCCAAWALLWWPVPPLHCNLISYVVTDAGSELVSRCIAEMVARRCEEVALEAEVTNAGALRLYENLGFIRDKRLQR